MVSRGCQGQFEVAAEDGSGFVDIPRQVICESKSEMRRECGVTVERRVTLVKQLSNAACEAGRSWGWDRTGIWVDKGCRGQFALLGYDGGHSRSNVSGGGEVVAG